MKTYKFVFNNRTRFFDAYSVEDAQNQFQERMGFWPSEDLVTMSAHKKGSVR